MMLPIDRRVFITSLGGAAAVGLMSHEAKADALEAVMMAQVASPPTGGVAAVPEKFPSVAEIRAEIPTRAWRKGTGNLFYNNQPEGKVPLLPQMPAQPKLTDFFELRFDRTRNHCLQSANKAMQSGADEEVILACLLHDTVLDLIKPDHGWWGAQMYEPYVPERTTFAIRYHQALRFYADTKAGYEYPDLYRRMFGHDYVPEPHIEAAYEYAKGHRWYGAARQLTVCDLYAFDPNAKVSIEPFLDIVGRHFRQPKEGLGNDNSAVAHMWRSLRNPDSPL